MCACSEGQEDYGTIRNLFAIAKYSYPVAPQTCDGLVPGAYAWNRRKLKQIVIDPREPNLREMKYGLWLE